MITSIQTLKTFTQALAKQNQQMAHLIELHGMPNMQPWQAMPFSKLIASIASQQLSIKAAQTIYSRVENLFSDSPKNSKYNKKRPMLSATKIAHAQISDLRACGLSNAKSQYCIGIAKAVIDNEIDLEALKKISAENAIIELVKLKGVGKWTAEMFAIFAIGHKDIFAVDDLGLQKGVQILLGLDVLPVKKDMLDLAEQWRPYRSIASWYLWRLVESS